MNAGKSTLVNALTRQNTSIVDATPGTTADTKIALMELHEIGPVKIFDTAGINEAGELGDKKARKTLAALKETDAAVIVVNAVALAQAGTDAARLAEVLEWEKQLVALGRRYGSTPMLVVNQKRVNGRAVPVPPELMAAIKRILAPPGGDLLAVQADLSNDAGRQSITNFLQAEILKVKRDGDAVPAIPAQFLSEDAVVFLNIPMDAETPTMRLLRPQALVQEEAIRHFATTIAYRMNLNHARSDNPAEVAHERARFNRALQPVLDHKGPKLIITDSQAVDILHPWTLDEAGAPLVPFTTYSIAMINRMSGGRLQTFVDGVEALKQLREGDRVLVAEACNHNRITDNCNDIGMVQIPQVGTPSRSDAPMQAWESRQVGRAQGPVSASPPPPSITDPGARNDLMISELLTHSNETSSVIHDSLLFQNKV
uniref:G domain-containing protein n=1 Tax=Pyramimonas obovata TaxID=1411642 RepID=A0A7S0MUN0_9CHLO|mmetsp:Transcript_13588/g.28934  ORF Transcript_13588/g.28934 Transcript_13588/m.28934 type:complete len:428 (+) Transcript_13588:213-1496(+)